jgi:hypothetical protein
VSDHDDEQAEVEATFRSLDALTEFFGDRERAKLVTWRVDELERVGFSFLHASALAVLEDREPWRTALDLVREGCDPALAASIVMP